MRHLGVDYGTRRIGLAVSDEAGRFAMPLRTIACRSAAEGARAVAAVAAEESIERLVVGHARNLDGRAGPKARECEAFAERLRQAGLAVALWDERLSTAGAERQLGEAALPAGGGRHGVDAVAAQIILQSYLDARDLSP